MHKPVLCVGAFLFHEKQHPLIPLIWNAALPCLLCEGIFSTQSINRRKCNDSTQVHKSTVWKNNECIISVQSVIENINLLLRLFGTATTHWCTNASTLLTAVPCKANLIGRRHQDDIKHAFPTQSTCCPVQNIIMRYTQKPSSFYSDDFKLFMYSIEECKRPRTQIETNVFNATFCIFLLHRLFMSADADQVGRNVVAFYISV